MNNNKIKQILKQIINNKKKIMYINNKIYFNKKNQ